MSPEMVNMIIKLCLMIICPKDINELYRFGQTEDFKKRLQNYNSANSDKMKVILIYETKNAKK